MPDTQDTLLEEFQQIEGAIADSAEEWSDGGGPDGNGGGGNTAPHGDVDSLGDQTGRAGSGGTTLRANTELLGGQTGSGGSGSTAPRGNVDSLGDQTGRVDHGSSSTASSDTGGSLLSEIGGALAAGLGIVPLGLEIASLFDGGPAAPPTLTNYAMPDSIGFVGSTDDSGDLTDLDFGQMGLPRSYATPDTPAATALPAQSAPATGGSSQSQPIQITVHAMDAQSIMDRSDDIASAVQKAMLNLHPITDTIANL